MPMLPLDERYEWQPESRLDFAMWWLPEFLAATGCVCAGLMLWGPLAVVALVPLLRPGTHLVQLAADNRREVEAARARIAANELAVRQHIEVAGPIVAQSERLDLTRGEDQR